MTNKAPMDVQTGVRNARVSAFHIKLLLLCLSVLVLDGFDTALMGYVAPVIIDEWGISKSDLGMAMRGALVGLAMGIGRAGDIIGAFMGAWLFQPGLDYKATFMALLIPSSVASLALPGLMVTLHRRKGVLAHAE